MESSLNKLKEILKREIGLDASTVGEATITKILNQRMRSCEITEIDDYYIFLQNSKDELHALLETSVIPETWFFRDHKPFDVILASIKKQRLANPGKQTRILCIPCSTGEEPYSIAMFLTENGIPETAFEIQAVDISLQSLDIAKIAYYGRNSFRGKIAKDYIDKYFEEDDKQYKLNDKIRNLVNFTRVNILQTDSIPFKEQFDFILCRNLLIYFDVDTKKTAFGTLESLLKEDGVLFIGHSEYGSVPLSIFKTTKIYDVYGLIKNNDIAAIETQHPPIPVTAKKTSSLKNITPPKTKAFSSSKYTETKPEKPNQQTQSSSDKNLLEEARKLADTGDFGEAEELCLRYIEEHGDHSESFFLLGLINEASGKTGQAHDFYKKSLYLDPKHYETLIHLSFLVEQQGDIEGSQRLRERAERVLKE